MKKYTLPKMEILKITELVITSSATSSEAVDSSGSFGSSAAGYVDVDFE